MESTLGLTLIFLVFYLVVMAVEYSLFSLLFMSWKMKDANSVKKCKYFDDEL